MKDRFEGEDGRLRLLEALLRCEAVRSDRALAEDLIAVAELREHSANALLIGQGAHDSDMAFLLSGEVTVEVGDRVVARRRTGDHVGEMAAIDPRASRSAAVRAAKLTVAAWVQERQLVIVANKHPHLWRAFAATLADRLRERGKLQRPRRMESRVLLMGEPTPTETLERLKTALVDAHASLVCWARHERPSTLPLDELRHEAEEADFAIVDLREPHPEIDAALELGLLLGVLGRERVFVVRASETTLPTYLDGLTQLRPEAERWSAETVSRIAARVKELEPR